MTEQELFQIITALFLSKTAPRFQKRLDMIDEEAVIRLRYFENPRRSSLILIDEIACVDPSILTATLLHGVPEDGTIVTAKLLESTFPTDAVRWIRLVTKDPKEGYIHRLRTCEEWQALLVELATRLQNLRTIASGSQKYRLTQIGETRMEYLPMLANLPQKVPSTFRPGVERALMEMESITTTYESQLAPT